MALTTTPLGPEGEKGPQPGRRHQDRSGEPPDLSNAARAAYALAVFAAENAIAVAPATYAAITEFNQRVADAQGPNAADEAAFLKAYEELGRATQPISAKSLRDTDDSFGSPNILGKKRSEARRFAAVLAARTGLILLLLGIGEFTQTFIRTTLAKEEEAGRLSEERRKLWVQRAALERRASVAPDQASDAKGFVLTDALLREKDELERQIESTEQAQLATRTAADEGTAILGTLFRIEPVRLRYLLPAFAQTLGSFVLPLLYGALGACAFLLRRVVQMLHDRSFVRKRSADYGVRFYLGIVSGVAVQWVFVGDGKQVPGGFTPAVLAFAGGYSVDVIFAVFDRVIRTVTEAIRPSESASGTPTATDRRSASDSAAPPPGQEERRAPDRPFKPASETSAEGTGAGR